jgi:nitrate reductase beta subunit
MSKRARLSPDMAQQIHAAAQRLADVDPDTDVVDAEDVINAIADTLRELRDPMEALVQLVTRGDAERSQLASAAVKSLFQLRQHLLAATNGS